VEAKKLTLGPQNVLTQAERYSKGATTNPLNFDGYRVPFLYSSNGEIIWFRDARHRLNRSRRAADFHTPGALTELMDRDFDGALEQLRALPNDHPKLRPYAQRGRASGKARVFVLAGRMKSPTLMLSAIGAALLTNPVSAASYIVTDLGTLGGSYGSARIGTE
jgi:hypothetical protein